MDERFTDRARKVMRLADAEARRFNHEYIGTEHLLLGLIREDCGVACLALKELGIDLRKVRIGVERLIISGPGMVKIGQLRNSSTLEKVLQGAVQEAGELNHNHVGTEHLLLAFTDESTSVAYHVLEDLGVTREKLREAILTLTTIEEKDQCSRPPLSEQHSIRATAIPGVSHTEGLCGEVLNHSEYRTNAILDSLGTGHIPNERVNLRIDVVWRGTTDPQHLDTTVELAFRPLNTGGYYWVTIVRITSQHEVDLQKGISNHRCALNGRHLIVTHSANKSYAWLLPEKFSLHNPLVRDMIFSNDDEAEHRLTFTHLHALTSVFWQI